MSVTVEDTFECEDANASEPAGDSLRALISERPCIRGSVALDQVHSLFQKSAFKFLPVVAGEELLGIVSREQIGILLGSRFGFSVFGRKPLIECMMPHPFYANTQTPTHLVLKRVFARPSSEFFDDIALLEADKSFIGLIEVHALVKLQQRIINAKFLQVATQRTTLLRKNHQLRELGDEISAKNEQLAIARDKALDATRLKGEFLANMSHEIRTPMNGVIGMTSLLMDTQLTQEQEYFASIIRSSAESLLTVINDILDFSKLEAGKLEIQPAPFLLPQLVDSSVLVLAEKAAAKQLDLFWEMDRGIPASVVGDSSRLRQILVNLIGNAVKFTDTGEVSLSVRQLSCADDRYRIRFEITDTGPGIAAESTDLLFNAFTQLDGSSRKRHGGTGLGLSICKRLIDLMEGEIGYHPAKPQGACFWFELCLAAVDKTPLPPLLRSGFKPLPVWLVVDSAGHRGCLQRQLIAEGFAVCDQSFADAFGQLNISTSHPQGVAFSCVVVDYLHQSPVVKNFLHRLRGLPGGEQVPIVLLTKIGSPVDPELIALHRIEHTCYKPLRFRELSGKIAELCDPEIASSPCGTRTMDALRNIPSAAAAHALSPLRILVAEDSLTNQQVVKLFLRKFGHDVVLVANGNLAIAALQEQRFDVVLMDCMMPDVDGYEATRRIRTGECGDFAAQIPIIAMTANAMVGDREKCLAAGMDDYLPKPLRRHELIEKLKVIQTTRVPEP